MEKLKDYIEKNNVTIKNCIEVELLDEFLVRILTVAKCNCL